MESGDNEQNKIFKINGTEITNFNATVNSLGITNQKNTIFVVELNNN